nr:hypothetical protein [Spirulina subsalsa]
MVFSRRGQSVINNKGTGNREQGTGNWESGIGVGAQCLRPRESGIGSRESGKSNSQKFWLFTIPLLPLSLFPVPST